MCEFSKTNRIINGQDAIANSKRYMVSVQTRPKTRFYKFKISRRPAKLESKEFDFSGEKLGIFLLLKLTKMRSFKNSILRPRKRVSTGYSKMRRRSHENSKIVKIVKPSSRNALQLIIAAAGLSIRTGFLPLLIARKSKTNRIFYFVFTNTLGTSTPFLESMT